MRNTTATPDVSIGDGLCAWLAQYPKAAKAGAVCVLLGALGGCASDGGARTDANGFMMYTPDMSNAPSVDSPSTSDVNCPAAVADARSRRTSIPPECYGQQ